MELSVFALLALCPPLTGTGGTLHFHGGGVEGKLSMQAAQHASYTDDVIECAVDESVGSCSFRVC